MYYFQNNKAVILAHYLNIAITMPKKLWYAI